MITLPVCRKPVPSFLSVPACICLLHPESGPLTHRYPERNSEKGERCHWTNGQKHNWWGKAGSQNSHLNISTTQVKGSDPKLKPCQTMKFLGWKFMLILLCLTGKNEIFSIKDKTQTQLQSLQVIYPSHTALLYAFHWLSPSFRNAGIKGNGCQSKPEIQAVQET